MHESIGKTFKDKITGFEGVCTGRIEYITGCNQLLITPPTTGEGTIRDGAWLDEQRCEIIAKEKIVLDNGNTPGHGPIPPGTRRI